MARARRGAGWRWRGVRWSGEERVRVGKALADLHGLDEAFSTGKLFWTAVREMTRVMAPETEEAWLA